MLILKNWLKELLSVFVFLRHKSLMSLYFYLESKNKRGGIAATCFCYQIDKLGSYIGFFSKFGNTPYFPHGIHGIFISDNAVIGKNAVIFQGVTIGSVRTKGSKSIGSPIIGDNCYIGAGAKIVGNVKVGNNVRIGANAVVYKDVPDNSIVVCSPTRIIEKDEPLDNRFYAFEADGTVSYWEDGAFHTMGEEL